MDCIMPSASTRSTSRTPPLSSSIIAAPCAGSTAVTTSSIGRRWMRCSQLYRRLEIDGAAGGGARRTAGEAPALHFRRFYEETFSCDHRDVGGSLRLWANFPAHGHGRQDETRKYADHVQHSGGRSVLGPSHGSGCGERQNRDSGRR